MKDDTLQQLIAGYPSHGFVIDRDEAETLFHSVRTPTKPEIQLGIIFRKASESALGGDSPIIRRLDSDEKESETDDGTNDRSTRENGEPNLKGDESATDANGETTGDRGAAQETIGGIAD